MKIVLSFISSNEAALRSLGNQHFELETDFLILKLLLNSILKV